MVKQDPNNKDKKMTTKESPAVVDERVHNIDAQKILNELDKLDSLMRHLKNVREAALKIGKSLIRNGESEFGRMLIANSFIHDQSKFYGIEWENIADGHCEDKEHRSIAIHQHQITNPHHPEYWPDGIEGMPEIYLAEMICDTYARSTEMGTDLREWWIHNGIPRYGISKNGKTWKILKKYLDILLDKPFS